MMNTMKKIGLVGTIGVTFLFASQAGWGAFTTSNYVQIEGGQPELWLDNTGTGQPSYELLIDHIVANSFSIYRSGTTPFRIENGAENYLLYLDAAERIGIKTSTPAEELDIRSTQPGIRLDDTSVGAGQVDIVQSSNAFFIEGNSSQDMFWMDTRAPQYSLVVNGAGNIGVGTLSPPVDLHVEGDGVGSVEEVFRLQSSVPPQMAMRNSTTGKLWFFAMTADDEFKISLDGTGNVEAKFFANGNMHLAGNLTEGSDRDSKTAIEPVDSRKVLDAVVDLPISTWEYKKSEGVTHLGPMAQDFHAAFGLGDTPKGISSIDTGGVALAAIKGLNENLQEVVKSNQSKDKEIESLKERLTMLENLVNRLTAKEVVMNR